MRRHIEICLVNVSLALFRDFKDHFQELQAKGFPVPDYPAEAKSEQELEIKQRYAKVLGSAVNPVLREGNSDRRVAAPVKAYAQRHPHRNHDWKSSKSSVASMGDSDFFASERSVVMADVASVRIELVAGKETKVLKAKTPLLSGEVIDGSVMRVRELRDFYEREMESTEPGVADSGCFKQRTLDFHAFSNDVR